MSYYIGGTIDALEKNECDLHRKMKVMSTWKRSAAPRLDRQLRTMGIVSLVPPESFFVKAMKKEGPLLSSEVERSPAVRSAATCSCHMKNRHAGRKKIMMLTSILVAYATRYGSTQEVAEAIAVTLRERGLEVDLQLARNVRTLEGYDAIVLGAPIYMYHWHRDTRHFLARHRAALTARPIAIFALGPLHADEKEFQGAREQLDKELTKFPWLTPQAIEIFGGKIDPARLHFPFSHMPACDVRDWTAIRAWASELTMKLQPALV